MKKYSLCILTILLMLFTNLLYSGTTGKLVGRVTDVDTGDPIIGANVIILDKQIGAVTDSKGHYMIINIPAGVYNIKASRMDYAFVTQEGVKINLDLTTTLNFKLRKKAIGIEGVTVKAKRKLVEKDVTGTENIVTSEEMKNMPVENIQEIVAVTAGAVGSGENMHIRGGRSGEVVYTVDGMSVSNPVDGGFGMNLDMDAVSDMSIQTGGFTAEFGNAQSAIINLVTKSGGPNYFGKFELDSDHLIDEGNNSDQIKFALGGPILPRGSRKDRDKLTFYLNGSGSWTDTRYKDYYNIDGSDVLLGGNSERQQILSGEQVANINSLSGNRDKLWNFFDLGDRFRNNYQANAKMKFKISPSVKLTFAARGDRETYLPYSHNMKYSLQYFNHWTTTHDQEAFTFDHTVSPKMFYTIRGSRFTTDISLNSGVDRDWYFSDENWYFNPQDPTSLNYGVHIPGTGEDERVEYQDQYGNPKSIMGFAIPGSQAGSFIDDKTVTYTLRGDFTYQIGNIHSVKTGIEIKYNDIYKDRLTAPWDIDDVKRLPNYLAHCDKDGQLDPAETDTVGFGGHTYRVSDFKDAVQFAGGSIDGYKAYPWQGAYYLQDKMEWEGMIVNAGMRFDFWYLGDKYQVKDDSTGKYVDADWDYVDYIKWVGPATDDYGIVSEKVKKFQLMVSPRLGVSHPITEKDVLHFAYNYQSQLPPMQYVFTSATPQVGATGAYVGNPNLKPETTITYEVGVEHQMLEDYLLDVTLFYKNIHNLVSMMSNDYSLLPDTIAQAGRQYYLYITNDYGSARGAEFTLRKRFSNFWGFNIGYTYSWATGRNSDVHTATENLREFPLNWDIRHIGSFSFDFRIPQDEEFYLLGLKMHDKFYANLLWQIQSGEPYTPLSQGESDRPLDTNSKRMDWTNTANLKISKAFNLFGDSKIRLHLHISNLLDKKNLLYVYPKTGKPDDNGHILDYFDTNDNGILDPPDEYGKSPDDLTGAAIYQAYLNDPGIYSEGRRYTFGISFEW
jgi:outer membrane receptor protein involved in Fe transport